jgi:hypothetical protein
MSRREPSVFFLPGVEELFQWHARYGSIIRVKVFGQYHRSGAFQTI